MLIKIVEFRGDRKINKLWWFLSDWAGRIEYFAY